MTRRLIFLDGDPKNDKRFELCLTAVHGAGDKSLKRTAALIRQEAHILDALDAISYPVEQLATATCANCGCRLDAIAAGLPATREPRRLKPGTQVLEFDDDACALLEHYVETTAWLPSASRAAVDLFDWFATGVAV